MIPREFRSEFRAWVGSLKAGPWLSTMALDQGSRPGLSTARDHCLGLIHSKCHRVVRRPTVVQEAGVFKDSRCSKKQGCSKIAGLFEAVGSAIGLPSFHKILAQVPGGLFALCSNIGRNTAARKGQRLHADPVRAGPWLDAY